MKNEIVKLNIKNITKFMMDRTILILYTLNITKILFK